MNYWIMPGVKFRPSYKPKTIETDKVIRIVEREFQVPFRLMEEKTRKREIVEARHICMYLLIKFTNLTMLEIGKLFGGRDHSTVINARQCVNDLMFSDDRYKARVDGLIYLLT